MATLQCEICGGKLMAKAGGLFECEYCGMQYDKTRIQEMVQEIKGTVKVEGTVEVKGTVKLDGPVEVKGAVNVANLLKLGQMALENRQWTEARKHYDEVLNLDAESVEAHLGKCCAYTASTDIHEAIHKYGADLSKNKDLKNALRFMDKGAAEQLQAEIRARAEEMAKQAEEEARQEHESRKQALTNARKRSVIAKHMISVSKTHLVAVKSDGTVLAARSAEYGVRDYGQCKVSGWADMIAVAASERHTLGLRADGTVVATGDNSFKQCEVADWTNIIAIAADDIRSVGLRSDGTVLSTDQDFDFSGWTDIVSIASASSHVIGLRSNGRVIVSGENDNMPRDVLAWQNVYEVATDYYETIGLLADGTIAPKDFSTEHIRDIVSTAIVGLQFAGLHMDGTVTLYGSKELYWSNIVAITGGGNYLVGLRADGKLEIKDRSSRSFGSPFDTKDWKLFSNVDKIESERKKARKAAAKQKAERIATLEAERGTLQEEKANLKGFFTGKRRKEIEARLAEIETELKGL